MAEYAMLCLGRSLNVVETYGSDQLYCVYISRDFLNIFLFLYWSEMGINGKLMLHYVFALKTRQQTDLLFLRERHIHKPKIHAKRSHLQLYRCMHLFADPSTKVMVLLESGDLGGSGL